MPRKKKTPSVADQMAEKKPASTAAHPKPDVMRIANEVRASANSMSDVKREDAFAHGMRLIYGGASHVAAKTGRP